MELKKKLLNELSRKPIWQHSLLTLMQLGQPKYVVKVTQVFFYSVLTRFYLAIPSDFAAFLTFCIQQQTSSHVMTHVPQNTRPFSAGTTDLSYILNVGLTQAHLSLPCFLNFLPHPYSVSLPPFLALPSFLPLPPLSSLFPPSLTFLSLSPSLASLSLPPSLPFFFLPSSLPLSLPFYSLSPLLSAFLSPSLSPPQHASTDCRSYRGEDELWQFPT